MAFEMLNFANVSWSEFVFWMSVWWVLSADTCLMLLMCLPFWEEVPGPCLGCSSYLYLSCLFHLLDKWCRSKVNVMEYYSRISILFSEISIFWLSNQPANGDYQTIDFYFHLALTAFYLTKLKRLMVCLIFVYDLCRHIFFIFKILCI